MGKFAQATEELKKYLQRNIESGETIIGNTFEVLQKIDESIDWKKGETTITEQFVSTLNNYIGKFAFVCKHTESLPKSISSKTIHRNFLIDDEYDFGKILYRCEKLGVPQETITKLDNYRSCLVKALVQTKRRSIGLDTNSKKYGIRR